MVVRLGVGPKITNMETASVGRLTFSAEGRGWEEEGWEREKGWARNRVRKVEG